MVRVSRLFTPRYEGALERATHCHGCTRALGRGRFTQLEGAVLAVYCSDECLRAGMRENRRLRWARRRRRARQLVVGLSLVGASLTPHRGALLPRAAAPVQASVAARARSRSQLPFGPAWPATETSWLVEL